MTSPKRHSVTRAALAAALAMCLATGCGDGEEASGDAPPSPHSGASADAATAPSADDEATRPSESQTTEPPLSEPTDDATAGATDEVSPTDVAPRAPGDILPEPPEEVAQQAPAVPVAPTLRPPVERALASARTLRESGDRMGAVRALRAAEEEVGDDATLRLEAAWCFFEMAEEAFRQNADKFLVKGNIADAHLRLDQAAALHADLPTSAVLLAKILRYEEDPDRARTVLAEHVARFPGDRQAHLELGDMAKTARNWADADLHFTKAAQLDPMDGRSRLEATVAKQWLTSEGTASYTKEQFHAGYLMAARLLPEEDDPIRLLVGLYPNSRARRIAALDQVIDDRAEAVWARVWKSYVLRQGEGADPKAALDVLEEARKIDPKNGPVLVNRAETLAQMERWDDAVAAFTEALESGEPGTLEGASNALDQLLHMGAQSRTIPIAARDRAYDALMAANPQIGRFGNNAGLWYRDVGLDFEKSLKYYQASVAAQPNDQDYVNDTALIYLFHLRDRKEMSLPMFLHVLALVEDEGQEPTRGYWDALENLCKYYFETGRYEKVVQCAEKRADGRANINGRAYPSLRAAQYGNQAKRQLAEAEKGDSE